MSLAALPFIRDLITRPKGLNGIYSFIHDAFTPAVNPIDGTPNNAGLPIRATLLDRLAYLTGPAALKSDTGDRNTDSTTLKALVEAAHGAGSNNIFRDLDQLYLAVSGLGGGNGAPRFVFTPNNLNALNNTWFAYPSPADYVAFTGGGSPTNHLFNWSTGTYGGLIKQHRVFSPNDIVTRSYNASALAVTFNVDPAGAGFPWYNTPHDIFHIVSETDPTYYVTVNGSYNGHSADFVIKYRLGPNATEQDASYGGQAWGIGSFILYFTPQHTAIGTTPLVSVQPNIDFWDTPAPNQYTTVPVFPWTHSYGLYLYPDSGVSKIIVEYR